MASILQMTYQNIFGNEKDEFLLKFLWKFVPLGPIEKTLALAMVMAWFQAGGKSLH